ncbi:helix-turn-helix domain-containing protein [Caenibius sp. WL]|uniref:helix-turn-helix domain-containing protein n=1 Tax=Caenibius sp. WL TaxID=2872646 RepID=UPI001C98EC0A|nr:helix-turn-helix domain-containing protein [Caenibius sp. WL]QZP07797.1 hypothetical protein K5X80_14260 [Caenibius sp. WL]QZP09970.1 hypothetical protein K5X80_16945 [Caenibius sp. WL]
MFVADALRVPCHYAGMLDSKGLITALESLKAAKKTTNADIARLLNLPTSRVAECFSGKRRITIDEMKVLVEHFGLEATSLVTPNAETLEPILGELLLPLVPPGRLTDQSRKALAQALSYALELLDNSVSSHATEDAIKVAARAAALRFRDSKPQ